jgi:hypothetical protein
MRYAHTNRLAKVRAAEQVVESGQLGAAAGKIGTNEELCKYMGSQVN